VVVVVLALGYLLGPLFARWRPRWTKPFVAEFPSDVPELPKERRIEFSKGAIALTLLSVIGSAALIAELIPRPSSIPVILLLAGWVRLQFRNKTCRLLKFRR
jgi:hypothetical protein